MINDKMISKVAALSAQLREQGMPVSIRSTQDAVKIHQDLGEEDRELLKTERTPLCSRVATGISWSSLGGLKGVKPPEAFGERPRDWSLGHAGDEGPHLAMTAESRGCSRAAAPVFGFKEVRRRGQ